MGTGKRTIGIIATVILAMLLLVVAHTLNRSPLGLLRVQSAKHIRASADLQTIRSMLEIYKAQNGGYPTTEQGLTALVIKPTLPRMSAIPKDPWDNDYVYSCPGRTRPGAYDLFSVGPDGVPYTTDDDWGE